MTIMRIFTPLKMLQLRYNSLIGSNFRQILELIRTSMPKQTPGDTVEPAIIRHLYNPELSRST